MAATKPLTIPNLPLITRRDPQFGEALKQIAQTANLNVTGNLKAAPTTIASPTKRPG